MQALSLLSNKIMKDLWEESWQTCGSYNAKNYGPEALFMWLRRALPTTWLNLLIMSLPFFSFIALGGTTGSKSGYYRPIKNHSNVLDEQNERVIFTHDCVFDVRTKIINSRLTEEEKIQGIASLYERAIHLFETPGDFVTLLRAPKESKSIVAQASDRFLTTHLKDFFAQNPELVQIKQLIAICSTIDMTQEIMSKALALIKLPSDYLELTHHTPQEPSAKLKLAYDSFIRGSLAMFQETKPSIDEVMNLHQYVLSIQVDVEKTIATLIKIKDTFKDEFSGADLIRLMSYGCSDPAKEYCRQLEELKKLHAQNTNKTI